MMNELKILKDGVKIPSSYIKDIETLANRVRSSLDAELVKRGLPPYESDITYRASAAWKDCPTHYCYIGDHSTSRINYGDSEWSSSEFIPARSFHSQLVGFARVVWELGGQLTFDENGKHTVFFEGCYF